MGVAGVVVPDGADPGEGGGFPSGDQEDDPTAGQSASVGTTTERWPVVRPWTQRPSSQA